MKIVLFFLLFISIKIYPFKLEIVNIKDREAPIYIAVFDQEDGFPYRGEKGIFTWKGTPSEAERGVSIDLSDGDYAVVIFQDVDGNGKFTKWFFGKPREPYGLLGAVKKPKKSPDFFESSKHISSNSILHIKLWEP